MASGEELAWCAARGVRDAARLHRPRAVVALAVPRRLLRVQHVIDQDRVRAFRKERQDHRDASARRRRPSEPRAGMACTQARGLAEWRAVAVAATYRLCEHFQLLRHCHAGEGGDDELGFGRAARQRVFVNAVAEPALADVGHESLLERHSDLAEVVDRALAVLVHEEDLVLLRDDPGVDAVPPQHARAVERQQSLLPDVEGFGVEGVERAAHQQLLEAKQAGAVRGGGRRCHSAAAAAAAVTVDGRRRQRAAAARLQESVRRRQSQQRLRRLRRVAGERRQESGFELHANGAGGLGGQRVAAGRSQQMQACAHTGGASASAAAAGARVRAWSAERERAREAARTWSVEAQLRHRHHQREALVPRHVPQIGRDERSAQRVQPGQHLRRARASSSERCAVREVCGVRGGHVQSAPSRAAAAAPPRRAATT